MPARKYKELVTAFNALALELDAENKASCALTFAQISEMAGEPLPPSAYKHRPWWSNNKYNNNSNRPWERAGFEAREVDFDRQTVTFRRLRRATPETPSQSPSLSAFERQRKRDPSVSSDTPSDQSGMSDITRAFTPALPSSHHPLRGALKGTIRIADDTDLTEPADPLWGAEL